MITFRYLFSFFIILFCLFFLAAGYAYSGASPPLTVEQSEVYESLVKAYKASEGRFWTAFGDNDEKINGPVLEKLLGYAIEVRDDALINIILEGARKKNDEKVLTAMVLTSADYFLFASRLDESLKLYDASMPLARRSEDAILIARSYEGNGDAAFYQGNPTNALLMYNKASDIYAKDGSNVDRGIIARKMADVYSQTGDAAKSAKLIETSLKILSRERSPIEEAHAYRSMGYAAMMQRDYKTALGALELAAQRYRRRFQRDRRGRHISCLRRYRPQNRR